ncbi:acyl carrier protein [Mesorhizobium xinjiangense]|uniref:acyl carrier protein n=1 Tax=Mesorhizobium xinjiangense TaxID=2678685 RepID=UPI0012EE09E3|nr:acyl carrier protein [Mesorhizobium xinjiangense]
MTNAIDEARDILAGCLFMPKEKIAADAEINAIGELDSLTFEMIVLEIEHRIGRTVDPVQLLEMRSVKDLAEILETPA